MHSTDYAAFGIAVGFERNSMQCYFSLLNFNVSSFGANFELAI
jgi:hypothetical protein